MNATRDPRPLIYGVLDLCFAGGYSLLIALVIPNRHAAASLLLWCLVASCAAMGISTLVRKPRAWRVAVVLCGAQLVFTAMLLAAIVISAAYLAGIYGAYGKGASMLALVATALVIEIFGLLPAFQLKYLLTDAGRSCFSRPVPTR